MEWLQWIWIAVALLLMIAQIFVPGQSLIVAGVGAVLAALLGLGGISFAWQLLTFLFIGLIGLLRRPPQPMLSGAVQETVFDLDRLVGEEGIVITSIDPERLTGRVLVEREVWNAYSDTGEFIPDGAQVFVLAVHPERLRVRPIPNEPPPRTRARWS
ncbi:MAG: NfeD family protein [Caldilineaceae bacterium]|nr:NfeD family protein [Caldilineaceae bacterium]MCB9138051.1 NfeD family protein [Caldilineaceae bacterium]